MTKAELIAALNQLGKDLDSLELTDCPYHVAEDVTLLALRCYSVADRADKEEQDDEIPDTQRS